MTLVQHINLFSCSEVVVALISHTCAIKGYIQYRFSGEPHRLDVDTLNEQLQMKGAARMRTSMKPDEAFGMIFDLEGSTAGSP